MSFYSMPSELLKVLRDKVNPLKVIAHAPGKIFWNLIFGITPNLIK